MIHWMLQSLVVYSLVRGTITRTMAQRRRRIINGITIDNQSQGYDVVRYFAWVSAGHESYLTVEELSQLVLEVSDLRCSGALIAPTIVQTVCHCVAVMVNVRQGHQTKVSPLLKNVWETLMRTYIGFNRVADMKSGIPAKAYITHNKCAKLVGHPWITHDYGWISLQHPVTESDHRKFFPNTFAPMYTVDELAKIWRYTLQRSLVCLYVGYGAYNDNGQGRKSQTLRHTWAVTLSYPTCEFYSKTQIDPHTKGRTFNYSTEATWSCTMPFIGKNYKTAGKGDSGGPVTCDNQYFSIISQGKKILPWKRIEYTDKYMSVDAAIAFAIFQNAVEYRRSFMQEVDVYHALKIRSSEPTFIPYSNRHSSVG